MVWFGLREREGSQRRTRKEKYISGKNKTEEVCKEEGA
jgi:hypothetical protein